MILTNEIYFPIVNPFNWEGFKQELIYDTQAKYLTKWHPEYIHYFQFRSNVHSSLKLRLRDSSDVVVQSFDFVVNEFTGAKLPFMYDCYAKLVDIEEGIYYLDIYKEDTNEIYGYCEPFYITEDCEDYLDYTFRNDIDKDGVLYKLKKHYTGHTTTEFMCRELISLRVKEGSFSPDVFIVAGEFWINHFYVGIDTTDTDLGIRIYCNEEVISDMGVTPGWENFGVCSHGDYYADYLGEPLKIEVYKLSTDEVLAVYENIIYTLTSESGSVEPDVYNVKEFYTLIESNFRQDDLELKSTFNQFTDQEYDSRVASSTESEVETLTIGSNGIPNWLAKKCNRWFGLTSIGIQGVQYSKAGDLKQDEKEACGIGKQLLKIPLQKSYHPQYEVSQYEAYLMTENYNPITNEDNKYIQS